MENAWPFWATYNNSARVAKQSSWKPCLSTLKGGVYIGFFLLHTQILVTRNGYKE